MTPASDDDLRRREVLVGMDSALPTILLLSTGILLTGGIAWSLWSAWSRVQMLNEQVDQSISRLLEATARRHKLIRTLCDYASQIVDAPEAFAEIERCRQCSEQALEHCLHRSRSNEHLKALARAEIDLRESLSLVLDILDPDDDRESNRPADHRRGGELQAAIKKLREVDAHFSFAAQAYNNALASSERYRSGIWSMLTRGGPVQWRDFIDWEPEPSDAR